MQKNDSIELYAYTLPPELIAQQPKVPRESAKLMVLSRQDDTLNHKSVADLPDYLSPGDVLVVNNSKVFKARLIGSIYQEAIPFRTVELFLVKPLESNNWIALGKPGKKLTPGTTIYFHESFKATVMKKNDDGTVEVSFGLIPADVITLANQYGHVPVPPYIRHEPDSRTYQTAYAKIEGSVAAPTAGFHLTPSLLDKLKQKGVRIVEITLHVGLGTFLPVKTDTLSQHHMHSEWAYISTETAETINRAKREHRRIIAIGTTTVRTLEGVAQKNNGVLSSFHGDINLFITEGFHFSVIDGMLTNFHLPKSTLLVLVSAFAGRKKILSAYTEAIRNSYRFYSFGDAMIIL